MDTARCFPTCSKALASDVAGHWLPTSGCGTCFPGVPFLGSSQVFQRRGVNKQRGEHKCALWQGVQV